MRIKDQNSLLPKFVWVGCPEERKKRLKKTNGSLFLIPENLAKIFQT